MTIKVQRSRGECDDRGTGQKPPELVDFLPRAADEFYAPTLFLV